MLCELAQDGERRQARLSLGEHGLRHRRCMAAVREQRDVGADRVRRLERQRHPPAVAGELEDGVPGAGRLGEQVVSHGRHLAGPVRGEAPLAAAVLVGGVGRPDRVGGELAERHLVEQLLERRQAARARHRADEGVVDDEQVVGARELLERLVAEREQRAPVPLDGDPGALTPQRRARLERPHAAAVIPADPPQGR